MYEVEVKVAADHAAVRDELATLDAESVGTVTQRDTYYDAPHRSFADTDEALRVRRVYYGASVDEAADTAPDETLLTYKGPLVDTESKTRREHETTVGDDETTDAIVRALGFEPAAVVEKEREEYRVGPYTVTLDAVTDVGHYVEVERDVEGAGVTDEENSSAVDEARAGAFELLRDLGLDPDDQIRTSYLGLLLDSGGAAERRMGQRTER